MLLKNSSGGKKGLFLRLIDFAAPCILAVAVIFCVANILSYDIVIEASINGESCGYVTSRDGFENAKLALEAEITEDIGEKSAIDCDVSYSIAYVKEPEFLTDAECEALVHEAASSDYKVANMLWVDGKMTAANENSGELESLISDIENELLMSAGDGYDRVEFISSLLIREQYCPVEYILPIDEINSMLNPLAEEEKSLRVSAFASLAPGDPVDPDVDFGLSRSITEEDEDSSKTLGYYLVSTETVDETAIFETEYIDDPDHFVGTDKLIQEGSDGYRTVTYEISSNTDGREIGRIELEETVHVPVVNEIIMKGSKPIPEAVPTGTFIWPCAVTKGLSSGYGSRDLYGSYDFHLGIDIPGTKGDEIYASDGGEVIWAGYTPSYGKSVRIQHDGDTITLYAHMNKLLVSVGDKVYQGQIIGEMGQTGAANGVHLHFEVRNGTTTTNPMNYLPELPEEDAEAFKQLEAAQSWEARKFTKQTQ